MTVTEGGSSEAIFTVTLLSARYEPVTVAFATRDGTARGGSDYVAASGTVTFQPGTTRQTVRVRILDDAAREPIPETFFLDVTGPPEVIVTGSQALAMILDDDPPPVVSIDDRSVAEGAAVNAAFRMTLNGPSNGTVTVDWATSDGTALNGSDFVASAGTLTFPPGRTAHSVFVPILSDQISEGSEQFFVDLVRPSGATLGDARAAGTIADPPALAKIPMYRAYNRGTDYHFFTTEKASKDFAVGVLGFQDESSPIPFYVWSTRAVGTIPLFRMYNPNLGRHFYTAQQADREFLMSIGMIYERDEGFLYPTLEPATKELFKLYNTSSGTHLFTADEGQKEQILKLFAGIWVQHASVGYVFREP